MLVAATLLHSNCYQKPGCQILHSPGVQGKPGHQQDLLQTGLSNSLILFLINSTEPDAGSWLTVTFWSGLPPVDPRSATYWVKKKKGASRLAGLLKLTLFLKQNLLNCKNHTANRKYYQKTRGGKRAVTVAKTLAWSRSFKPLPKAATLPRAPH